MKFAFYCLTLAVALLAAGCGTSSTTTTGPTLDRCGITVVNSMPSVDASGGTGRLAVTAGRECTWSMTSNAPWITARQPAGGQGDGGVEYVVAANPNPESRRGTVVVGGQVFEVVQEGLACQFELRPNNQNVEAEGGNGSFTVEGPDSCNWTPATSDEWITITNGGSRTGNGSVNFTVARNTGAARNGAIGVGGQAFSISQPAPQCRYSLAPTGYSPSATGGSSSLALDTAAGCAWTSSGVPAWITGVPANGAGPQTINFTVSANPNPAPRSANIVIGGQAFMVSQAAASCSFSLNPTSHGATASGGSSSFAVTTSAACAWTSSGVPAWITGVPANGTGTTTINFTVAANSDPGPRTANITIGGQTFTVSQTAASCSYSLNPTSHSATASGGSSSFAVTTAAACVWTSSGVPAWITGVPANGTGTTTINFTAAANSDPAPRTANITIGGQTFSVMQAAVACSYTLNPTSHSASAAGGPGTVAVNTAAGCAWTSTGVPTWIAGVPANGTGPQTITFTVAATTGLARNAIITIGGQTFTVSQASGCSYTLNPTSHSASASGGPGTVAVNTAAGCAWTSTGVPTWIAGVPANGTGPQTIAFTVAATTGPARNATIIIGGQTFTVSQVSGCTYTLNPTIHNASAAGGPGTVAVNTAAGCAWTSSGVPTWIAGVPANGTGPQTIAFTVAATTGPARNAIITIGGQIFRVNQHP